MQNTWKKTDAFAAYRCSYDVLSSDTKKYKDMQRNHFFELMRLQIRKHNGCYLKRISILRSVFGEQQTDVLLGKLIKEQDPFQNELDNSYVSKIHKTTIYLNHLYSFLKEEMILDEINLVKGSPTYVYHQQHVQSVIDGTNIWDKENGDESV